MAIKRRSIRLVTDGAGAATGTIGLGAGYGRVLAVGFDSDDDASSDYTIESQVFVTGTATEKVAVFTAVDASTPVVRYLTPVETRVFDAAGDAMIDAEGAPGGIIAKSPVTVTVANGGASKVHNVSLFVEV